MMIYADRLRFWIDFVKVIKKVESTILSLNKWVMWVKVGFEVFGRDFVHDQGEAFLRYNAFLKSRLK